MEEIIKKYLTQRALTDESVARNLKKPNKSMKGCCDYIMQQARKAAKKSNFAMVEDDVVYGWAVHYFDEDNLQEDKNAVPTANVIVPKAKVEKPKYVQFDLFGEGFEDETEDQN